MIDAIDNMLKTRLGDVIKTGIWRCDTTVKQLIGQIIEEFAIIK